MKKKLLFFLSLFYMLCLYAEGNNYKDLWQIKTYREKYSYIEGFFDCGKNLSIAIENKISIKEKQKLINKETADYIEIPIIYISFATGNSQTNGIDSIITYLDECYKNEQLNKYSVYELLTGASKMGLKNLEQFQWIFDEDE